MVGKLERLFFHWRGIGEVGVTASYVRAVLSLAALLGGSLAS